MSRPGRVIPEAHPCYDVCKRLDLSVPELAAVLCVAEKTLHRPHSAELAARVAALTDDNPSVIEVRAARAFGRPRGKGGRDVYIPNGGADVLEALIPADRARAAILGVEALSETCRK